MKLDNATKRDFCAFWKYWLELENYARAEITPDEDGEQTLTLSNCMMVAAYAAHAWFANKAKKEAKK